MFLYCETVWSVLQSESFEDICHLLLCLDVGRYEWQSEHILDHAHVVEQGLHAGRVAVDEEQGVELGELMVDLAGWLIFAVELQSDHT